MRNLWWTVKALFNQIKMENRGFKITAYQRYLYLIFVYLLFSCNNTFIPGEAGPDEYFTCSMDPQVVENKPGNCPICHMKLIKVKKNSLKEGQIKLSEQQIKLANITYDTIRNSEFKKEIVLTGKVTVDQNLSNAISARVQGRIEKLNVKAVGDYINKGHLLYEIYSEELSAAQVEFILSLGKQNEGFMNSAKNKLLLYGMSESQIIQLKLTKKIFSRVPVYSTYEGYVTEISANEGGYVNEGMTLFRIASLSSLWVEAQVYMPFLKYLKIGTHATFSIPAASENTLSGNVIFIDPQVQSPERFVLARFQIANSLQEIKPGMLASIILQSERKMTLVLPISAVIQDTKGPNVWIRRNNGVFENKMVSIGLQNSQMIEITSGLVPGEVVVITGTYLLNSEYVFKKGVTPMKSHSNMPGMKM